MKWKQGDPKPRRNDRPPFKELAVECLWCEEKMKGKSYCRHAKNKNHEYLSYKVKGVGNINFAVHRSAPVVTPVLPAPKKNQESQQMNIRNSEAQIEPQQGVGISGDTVQSQKRDRQVTLFETSWGKLQRFEEKIGDILKNINDPRCAEYLEKIQTTMKLIQKAEIDIRGYRDQKRQKMNQLMQLEKTLSNLGDRNRELEKRINQRDDQLLNKEMSATARVIRQEDLNRVEAEYRDKILNILKSNHHFLISENGEELECKVCDENWDKAKLTMHERRGKIKITKFVTNHADRHAKTPGHRKCVRAMNSFK